MRLYIIALLAIPFCSEAQINRSANELAHERIREYIVTKIFKDLVYKPVAYSPLQEEKQSASNINWSIGHKFEIIDTQFVADKKTAVIKPYYFSFYLDKKMKVVAAGSYHAD